jgi:hypothetical protein
LVYEHCGEERFGNLTAEAPFDLLRIDSGRRVKFFIKTHSELCVLGVSVVNLLSQ